MACSGELAGQAQREAEAMRIVAQQQRRSKDGLLIRKDVAETGSGGVPGAVDPVSLEDKALADLEVGTGERLKDAFAVQHEPYVGAAANSFRLRRWWALKRSSCC